MKLKEIDWVGWALPILILCALVIVVLSGCHCLQPKLPEIIPDTPYDAFIKTVYKTNWLVTVGIISVVISAVAFKNGTKNAGDWLLGSILLVGITLAVIRFGIILAIVCMGIGIGWLVYTLFIKDRALKEIIKTVEYYKDAIGSTLKENTKEVVKDHIQSPQTTKLVSKIKND